MTLPGAEQLRQERAALNLPSCSHSRGGLAREPPPSTPQRLQTLRQCWPKPTPSPEVAAAWNRKSFLESEMILGSPRAEKEKDVFPSLPARLPRGSWRRLGDTVVSRNSDTAKLQVPASQPLSPLERANE